MYSSASLASILMSKAGAIESTSLVTFFAIKGMNAPSNVICLKNGWSAMNL